MHFGFSLGREYVSKFIKWLTKSEASHTYMCFDIAGETVILHSNQYGVNIDTYENFFNNNDAVVEYDLELTKEEEDKVLGYAVRQLHRPFDYLAAFGFLWVLINKAFGRKVKNPMPNRSSYFCSELVVMSLKAANFEGADKFKRELTSPEDLIQFFDKQPKAKKVHAKE